MMHYTFILVLLSFSFSENSGWWGCTDESAVNYDPYAIWDCGSWCCEYEDTQNSGIVINEINYNPSSSYNQSDEDYEFIEFYNSGLNEINLEGWSLSNTTVDQCFIFENISISPGDYLILARNSETYSGSINYGEHNSLSNEAATLTLRDLHHNIIDRVSYKDDCDCTEDIYCWPTNADAGGSSLELIDFNSNNMFASSWQDSYVIPGGTPGYSNSSTDEIVLGCTDQNACNFNQEANLNDESCLYPDENFDCEGNCTVEIDCLGECGGIAIEDCLGECNGIALVDDCGICNGENQDLDCNGVCFGGSTADICGTCNGEISDSSLCADEGFSIGIVNSNIENNFFDIVLNNESEIAGFQFGISGIVIDDVAPLSIENLNFSISFSDNMVIAFSLEGELIPASNSDILRVYFSSQQQENICLDDIVLSNPVGEEVDFTVSDCISLSSCTDNTACNYFEYDFSCDDCCNYGTEFWLDTDGDGLGYLENGEIFCEDPGFPWVPNHGDEYPNCFSNEVDNCGVCDGDNSSCSGCLDELAFNYNCLNGNWPTTATFGCSDDVLIDDSSCLYPPEGFEFLQSSEQAFYKFLDGSFNGESLEFMGSWIGAFRDGICVGSWPWVGEFTQVPVMGYDGSDYTENYMNEGEFPEFYIYDPTLDDTFLASVSEDFPYINLEIYHVSTIESSAEDFSSYGYYLGDINIDYQVDIMDMTSQINFILNFHSPDSYQFWASDLNADEILNVADVVRLSNNILGFSRLSADANAVIDNNILSTSGSIGGIQFKGKLISDLSLGDIIESNNDINIIYNTNGLLNTDEFVFESNLEDLLVVTALGDPLSIDTANISDFELSSIYPNPFNPSTTISFSISNYADINLSIYDLNGRLVDVLVDEYSSPGSYSVVWDASRLSTGMYLLTATQETSVETRKLMLIK